MTADYTPDQQRLREIGDDPDDQATIFEFDMTEPTTDTDDDTETDRLDMNINPDDFWTFDQSRRSLHARAEQYNPNVSKGDLKSTMPGLTGFQRDLLYVIMGSDKPSGQEIRRRLENDTTIAKVNNGRLYSNLDSLVDSGLVEKGDRDQSTNYYEWLPPARAGRDWGDRDQRTNYYDLTDAGRDAIENRREWEAEMLGGRP